MSGGGNAGDCPAMNGSDYANQNGIYWVRAWIGGGQGSHQALNQTGSNWNILQSAVTIPVKNQLGSTTEFAMVDKTSADSLSSSVTPATVDTTSTTPANTTGQCTVPNLTGRTVADVNSFAGVTADIVGVGLKAGTVTRTESSTSPISTTQITSQSPTAGTSVDCNTMVSYEYSLANGLIPNTIIGSNSNSNSVSSTITAIPVSGTTTQGCFLVGKGVNSTSNPKVKSISFTPIGGTTLTYGETTTASVATPFPSGGVYATCGLPISYIY
jgi:hypothetical protein